MPETPADSGPWALKPGSRPFSSRPEDGVPTNQDKRTLPDTTSAAGRKPQAGCEPRSVLRDPIERGDTRLGEGRWVRVEGFRTEVVDTNGAGDVFHGACAYGELRDWPFIWVLTFASAVAAMKCRHLGGRRGIPRALE